MLFIDKNHILISFWFNYVDKSWICIEDFRSWARNYFLIYRFVRAFFHWLLIHQLMMTKNVMRLRVMWWAGKFEALFCSRLIGLIFLSSIELFVCAIFWLILKPLLIRRVLTYFLITKINGYLCFKFRF